MSTYQFLPWVRSGWTTLIQTPPLGKDEIAPNTPGHVTLPVTIKLNGTAISMPTGVKPPRFYGPGDVIGIEAREIIRPGPLDLTPDYQPERFAFIEFDRPDFPWLFTPGAPSNELRKEDRLRPWLVLIVVEKSQATITPPTGKSLPILSCPLKELPPNLNESWAWAHAVYAGAAGLDNKSLESELGKNPERNLSRLLCARKLAEHRAYEACLVPAFEAGRKAGLGLPSDENAPLAHWSFATDADVKLPVYYHWSFSTGAENLFIKLAKQLRPLEKDVIPPDIAGEMDLEELGNDMKQYKLAVPSALRITPPTPETPEQVKEKLRDLLLKPKETSLPLPIYGSWHAQPGTPPQQLDGHKWLNLLNLDPRYRVAAALGTSVIQKEQDHLIAVAWEQVGDLQRANELLQRKQLACCVTESIHKKRLSILSTSVFLQFAEPLPPPKSQTLSSIEPGFRSLSITQVKGKGIESDGSISKTGSPVRSTEQANEPLTIFAEQVLADQPVVYYRLNDSPGSPTVQDSSGHANHGAVSTSGVTLGVPGLGLGDRAAQFDGATGRIVIPNNESLNPARITMEAMIKWDGPTNFEQAIFGKLSYHPKLQYGMSILNDAHVYVSIRMRVSANYPIQRVTATSIGVVTKAMRTHVVATYDGRAIRIYLNGTLDSTVQHNDPSELDIDVKYGDVPLFALTIGDLMDVPDQSRLDRFFNGLIDDIAMYQHALSPDRIRTHALAASPQTQLERVATMPQFRRVTRPSGSWALTGNVTQYPLDQIAPPPGVTNDAGQISGYRSPKPLSLSRAASGLDLPELRKQALLDRTEPQKTFSQDVASRVTIPKDRGLRAADAPEDRFHQHGELGLYTYAAKFSQPMYELLRDQFPHMLLPGLDKIPNDRVARLKPNPSFIEAYMVGLNHEMSREFLWREFPTLLNTTYFQQFWDARSAANPKAPDVLPIDQWADHELGTNLAPDRGGGLTFLLIRGELIVRYPNALIYARKKDTASNADVRIPVLRFSPIAGVTLVGFNLDQTATTQWTFFVEEHFTEPYLGPDPNAEVPPGSQYVSFAKDQNKYKNSAGVAKESLQNRFYIELPVPPEAPQD